MAPVGDAAAHVVDRAGGGPHQLAEAGERGRRQRRAPLPAVGLLQDALDEGLRVGARITVGAADPMAVRTVRPGTSRETANEQTAMTMALRGPTFANCWGPRAAGTRIVRMSSSGAITLRLGPVQNSSIGTARAPPDEASSTVAPEATRGGRASPAGDAVATFPPIVPRCGSVVIRQSLTRSPAPAAPSASSRTARV